MPAGYCSKVTSAQPIRGLSAQMFEAILDGLAVGIVAIALVEDHEQAAKMQHRWTKRRRRPSAPIANSPPTAPQRSFDLGHEAGRPTVRR